MSRENLEIIRRAIDANNPPRPRSVVGGNWFDLFAAAEAAGL